MNAQKMSIRELGRLSGADYSGISKVLSGQREGSIDFYLKIAHVFNGVVEMLQVAGVVAGPADLVEDLSMWEILKAVKALTPQERQEVEEYLDYLHHRRDTKAKP
jgi:transcriptional regulator with XRE-family HTH domain